MANNSPVPRVFGLLAAVFCFFAICVAVFSVKLLCLPPSPRLPGVFVLDGADNGVPGKFPPVRFDHDRHRRMATANWSSCATCHNAPKIFTPVEGVSLEKRTEAWHAGCTSCHVEEKTAERSSGPSLVSCRACHNGVRNPSLPKNVTVPYHGKTTGTN